MSCSYRITSHCVGKYSHIQNCTFSFYHPAQTTHTHTHTHTRARTHTHTHTRAHTHTHTRAHTRTHAHTHTHTHITQAHGYASHMNQILKLPLEPQPLGISTFIFTGIRASNHGFERMIRINIVNQINAKHPERCASSAKNTEVGTVQRLVKLALFSQIEDHVDVMIICFFMQWEITDGSMHMCGHMQSSLRINYRSHRQKADGVLSHGKAQPEEIQL